MHKILIGIFLLIAKLSLCQGEVMLTVVNQLNEPIEFANFRLFSSQDSSLVQGAYSDAEGKIVLKQISFGQYYAVLSFFNYENDTIEDIHLIERNATINIGQIQIKEMKSRELDGVTITGKRERLSERSIAKRTYNVEKDMTGSGGGSVEDVLRNIPSVEVDNEGNVSLRGNGSVTILIDGRPSVLSSSGSGALSGIPASAIEKVEIVTNPSAKYNPDGTAGIINIILKKQKLKGFNLNTQFTAASYNLYNGSLNFNYRNSKLNFFASYSLRYREGERNSFSDRTSIYDDTTEFLQQNRLGTDFRRSHIAKIGTDFFLNKYQTLGISISGAYTDRKREGKQHNELSFNNQLNRYWNRYLTAPRTRKSLDINANYKLDFRDKKGNLTIAVTESIGDENNYNHSEEYYFYPNDDPFFKPYWFQNQNEAENKNKLTISTDLVRNINENIKYQAGIQAIIHRELSDNYLEELDTTSGVVAADLNSNNIFDLHEKIFSAYGTFGQIVNNWFEYQVGLRLEQALVTPILITTGATFKNNYFSFFPSAHFSFGTDITGKIYTSYSRRINRPRPWNLNPFTMRRDPRNLRRGNPNLKPEYINSYELGYQKNWVGLSLTGSIYFKETTDKIQRVRQFYDNQISISTFQNINKSYDYGAEFIISYQPFPWWNNMISANAYERRLKANIDGTVLNNKGISWDVKLNTTFSFFKNTTAIQINAKYYSKRYDVQGYYQFQPGVDVGITRTLLDKNLTIGVRMSDIFNQRSFYFEAIDNGQIQHSKFKWTSRRLYVTVSYKFGNLRMRNENKDLRLKIKESQEENGGTEM